MTATLDLVGDLVATNPLSDDVPTRFGVRSHVLGAGANQVRVFQKTQSEKVQSVLIPACVSTCFAVLAKIRIEFISLILARYVRPFAM